MPSSTPAAAPGRISLCFINRLSPKLLYIHQAYQLDIMLICVKVRLFVSPGGIAGAAGPAPGPAVGAGPASGAGPVAGHRARLPGHRSGLLGRLCTGRPPRLSCRGGSFLTGALLVPWPLVEPGRFAHLIEQRARSDPTFAFYLHPYALGAGLLALLMLGVLCRNWWHIRILET